MDPNWERVAHALAGEGVSVDPAELAAAERRAKHALDRPAWGLQTDSARGESYFHMTLALAGIERSPRTDRALAEVRAYHARHNLWESVLSGVPAALERLRGLGLQLVVVSNANGTLKTHLARMGLATSFDHVLDSHEEGVEKPDPDFFRLALQRAGARTATTLHVGDLYHVDVMGARAAGLRAVLLDEADLYDGIDCPRVASLGVLAAQLASGSPVGLAAG